MDELIRRGGQVVGMGHECCVAGELCRATTLRDYFAAQALTHAVFGATADEAGDARIARRAYAIADAMLAARAEGGR